MEEEIQENAVDRVFHKIEAGETYTIYANE